LKIKREGLTRNKPEEIIITWMMKEALNRQHPLCDLCNNEIDWEPFPVIDFPSDEELTDPDYVPEGGNAFCKVCALEVYGLNDNDAGKIDRLWACFDLVIID